MRKGILILGLVVLLLAALSSVAYSTYKAPAFASEKEVCCDAGTKDGETLFESIVKRFVGTVKF